MTALDSVVDGHLRSLHGRLAGRPHLRPGGEVDALFGELVRLAVSAPAGTPAPLATGDGPRLRDGLHRLCAAGEAELERHWAARIAGAADPVRTLEAFPYLGNYRRLARLEVDALAAAGAGAGAAGRPIRRVAFVGAGPLPLSALLLAESLGVPVDAVDRDPAAVADGLRVAAALSADGAVTFVAGDVRDLSFAAHDVVVLAALVGATAAAKRDVLAHLARAMAPGATLVARSARSARTLLYPGLDRRHLAGFELQAVVHPTCDVVNSVVVARATGAR
jgi:SAM-dependent methyltransferase